MHSTLLEPLGRFDADTIAGRPILDLAARTLDLERYDAFLTCYRTMRWVDDMVDDARSRAHGWVAATERRRIAAEVRRFTLEPESVPHPMFRELARVRKEFLLPEWTWRAWAGAMVSDLDRDGFATMREWLRYAEGAAVAPAAIFMHLCGARRDHGQYLPPPFDVRRAARTAAIFAYLVHVMRDFREDQLMGLHHFAADVMRRSGIGRRDLAHVAEGGPLTAEFRALMAEYHRYAGHYLRHAERDLGAATRELAPRNRVAPGIIMALYRAMFARTADAEAIARGRVTLGVEETLEELALAAQPIG